MIPRPEESRDGQIQRLGTAVSKDYPGRIRQMKQLRNSFPRLVNDPIGRQSLTVTPPPRADPHNSEKGGHGGNDFGRFGI